MRILPIYTSILLHAQNTPDKIALIDADNSQSLSYSLLAKRILNVVSGLNALKIKKGDVIALTSDHPLKHFIVACGIMTVGGIPAALPRNFPHLVQSILESTQPLFAIEVHDEKIAECSGVKIVDYSALEDGVICAPDASLNRAPNADDTAMIYFTSGTTSGSPKGVMQPYRELESTAENVVNIMSLNQDIIELAATPTESGYWFGRCRVVMRIGGTLVLTGGSLNPLRIVGLIDKFHCNALTVDSPLLLALVRNVADRFKRIAANIKWLKVASQALDPEIKSEASKLMPKAHLYMNYGLMEAMRVSMLSLHDERPKLDSVGQPCPGVNVRIVDPQNNILDADQVGEIFISGPNVAHGYFNQAQLWNDRYIDNWYHTGDLGYLDSDKYLYVVGRKDEAINIGGKTVSPTSIEDAISRVILNSAFCVCGKSDPDHLLGDIPVLCVEGEWKEEISWEQFKTIAREFMPDNLIPRQLVLVPEIPKTANSKPKRKLLRARLEEGFGTVIEK